MELSSAQEIIVKLKTVKERQNLSIQKIKEMVCAAGGSVADTTLRRVFAENSETDDSFNYEYTIKPIAQALLIDDAMQMDDVAKARVEGLEIIIEQKNEKIAELQSRIETMRAEHEARCAEYETRMAFLRNQIELKDQRMDRKDGIIEHLLSIVHPKGENKKE